VEFADEDHLPCVIGVVGADGSSGGCFFLKLGVVGGFYRFFQIGHDLIELADGFGPGFGVEVVEGFVVIVVVGAGLFASDAGKSACISKEEVCG
jgi:hypothetical protein